MEGRSISKSQRKIAKLKRKVKPKGAKSVLNNLDVKKYLEQLLHRFALVNIDKANFVFICKTTPNKTYF